MQSDFRFGARWRYRLVAVLAFLSISQLIATTKPARAQMPPERCVAKHELHERVRVSVGMILDCLANNLPVELWGVMVVADGKHASLDFGVLPVSPLKDPAGDGALSRRRMIGKIDPGEIEAEVGRSVVGFRLVRERFVIRDSVIEIPIKAPENTRYDLSPFAPLVFAKTVNLSGTQFDAEVDLALAQFIDDAIFEKILIGSKATSFGFVRATFFAETNFHCMRFESPKSGGMLNLLGAVMLGRVRLNCKPDAAEIGGIDLTEARIKGPSARFDDLNLAGKFDMTGAMIGPRAYFVRTKFAASAFNSTNFEGGAAFNGVTFARRADFTRTSFGAAPASFDSASFLEIGYFLGAGFAGVADFSGLTSPLGALNFQDAAFAGEARFHNATIGALNFENAKLDKGLIFTIAVLGTSEPDPRCNVAAVNLERTTINGPLDLTSAKLASPINLSHTSIKSGDFSASWAQLDGKIRLDRLSFGPQSGSCKVRGIFVPLELGSDSVHEAFYRRLEDNFRKQDRLSEAVEAYFLKEQAVTRQLRGSAAGLDSCWRRVLHRLNLESRLLQERVWGYGVRPLNVLGTWAIVIAAWAVFYWLRRGEIRSRAEAFALPRMELFSLPLAAPAAPPWPPVDPPPKGYNLAQNPLLSVGRALQLSFTVGSGIRIGSVEFSPPERGWVRAAVLAERLCGILLFALLTISLAQSIPLVGQIFSFVLK